MSSTVIPSIQDRNLTSSLGTRKRKNREEEEELRMYTNDTDLDDLANEYVDNLEVMKINPFPIDYKTIVIILLLSYYQNNEDYAVQLKKLNLDLEDIIDEIFENAKEAKKMKFNTPSIQPITKLTIKADIIKTAVRLYTLFFGLPNIYALSHQQSKEQFGDLHLYSGIRSYKGIIADNLNLLNENDEWYLPTFVSTSLSIDTALRFQDEKNEL